MKKHVLLFLLMLGFILISFMSYQEIERRKIKFKYEIMLNDREPTFKFTARSKHFAIETGEAFYPDKNAKDKIQSILIKNFKMLKEIENLKYYQIYVRFYELDFFNSGIHDQINVDIKDFISNLIINYTAWVTDPIYKSEEHEFKDNLHIIIKYCLNNDLCYEEEMKLNFID